MGVELDELKKKIDKGVRFAVTTPVFDLDGFQQTLRRLESAGTSVIPTVLLLKSAGMARYIDRNIGHISIPPETIQSIQKAPDKIRRCVQIAGETLKQLKQMGVTGVSVSTLGWEDKLPQILDEARV